MLAMSSLKPSHTPIKVATLPPYAAAYEMNHLSERQVCDRIENIIHTHLSPGTLQRYLKQTISEQTSSEQPSKKLAQSDILPTVAIPAVTAAYGTTCLFIWQSIWHPERFPKLDSQVQQLCLTWARAKRHFPDHPFFADHPTPLAALQAKWQNPDVQATLRHTTAQLQNNPLYASTVLDYPTCWAYVFGCSIHQLLQWNHQLTPYVLRELWP